VNVSYNSREITKTSYKNANVARVEHTTRPAILQLVVVQMHTLTVTESQNVNFNYFIIPLMPTVAI